jgi:hypothetical protein
VGEEIFLAVDEGVLVKVGQKYIGFYVTRFGTQLGQMQRHEDRFKVLDDRKKHPIRNGQNRGQFCPAFSGGHGRG